MVAWIAFALLAVVLIVAAATDIRTGKVYNWLTYPAILVGLVYWLIAGWLGSPVGIVDALVGLAAGLIPFAIIFALGGLGGGDVKLMAAVGAVSASWHVVLGAAFYGLLLAAAYAIVLMIRKGLVKRTLRRIFGAALLASAKVKAELDENTPRVPLAAAVAVGGIIAGLEQMLGWQSPWAWLS